MTIKQNNTPVYHDLQYLRLVECVLTEGHVKEDRTGTGTTSFFGTQMRFDVSDGTIPLLTTKKIHLPAIIHELLWYFSGSTNVKYLQDNNVRIWNEWADADGELGPLYGNRMRNWDGVDQLDYILTELRTNPDSRRMVVSYWDPRVLPDVSIAPKDNPAKGKQALAPCHYTWQVYTRLGDDGRRKMSLKMTQRSVDVFLGCPFNIAQYAMILHLLCAMTDMDPDEFIWSGGDTHIYNNHVDQLNLQLSREAKPSPTVTIVGDIKSFDDVTYDTIVVNDYDPHPPIKGAVAI